MMAKLFLNIITAVSLLISVANGALYKGHRIYVKVCAECHKDKTAFVKSKTQIEWTILMQVGGKRLRGVHISSQKAKPSWKFFNSPKYPRKVRHLKEFLLEYAKDSEKIPAFN